jgi:hypothetical protein
MPETQTPSPGYKPSMVFTSKCSFCGFKVKVLGWYAFNEACEEHLKVCKKNPEYAEAPKTRR